MLPPDASGMTEASVDAVASCDRDSACASNVCSESTGTCIPADEALFVSPAGDNANPCTFDQPCQTIRHALGLVDATKHTIRVARGTYTDSILIAVAQPILISGEGGGFGGTDINFVSINGHVHTLEIQNGRVVVEGMAFHGGTAETIRAQGGELTLWRAGAFGSALGGIDCIGCQLHMIESAVADHALVGIDAHGGGEIEVRRSTITSNRVGGVRVTGTDYDISSSIIAHNGRGGANAIGGFTITNAVATPVARFDFNTVADNGAAIGLPGGIQCGIASSISNSILADNDNAPVAAACNVTFTLYKANPTPGPTNFVGDPLFTAPAVNDYHITAGSPAIDHAKPTATEMLDIDGQLRPHGALSDVGADEFY
jgi:hypothetical protein